jgi:hypothetical protein
MQDPLLRQEILYIYEGKQRLKLVNDLKFISVNSSYR